MESLCDGCKQVYNHYERQRIQLNCGDNICLQCFDQLLQLQENKLICPHLECGETLIINKRFYDSISKMRENNQGLMIFCEKHQTQAADNFCQQHNILICDKCIILKHQNHVESIIEVKRQNFEDFCDNSIHHLISLKHRIDTALESLTAYKTKSKSFISDKIMALVWETQDILLNPHVKDDIEQSTLQFPAIIQQDFVDQEELKINPAEEEIKEQQPQPDQQEQQPNYAQPQPDQQVQNQNSFETEFDEYSRRIFGLTLGKYELLQKWIGRKVKLQLVYRQSGIDRNLYEKHIKLADCKPNITLIKSEHDQIFGGYASVALRTSYCLYPLALPLGMLVTKMVNVSRDGYVPCHDAFLFQLTKETKHELYGSKDKAICFSEQSIARFGNNDLNISDYRNSDSRADQFGEVYRLPENMQQGSKEAQCYLAGSPIFKVKEIEIYQVIEY